MDLGSEDLLAIWVTLKLGFITTVILLVICTPLAWWLSRPCPKVGGRSGGRIGVGFFKDVIAAIVSLPMVLPPTVLGFYLLVMMGPKGFLGQAMGALNLPLLVFSFSGLVVGSVIFSMPIVVQTLKTSFLAIEQSHLDAAATLGAKPLDRFFSLVLPLTRHGYLSAAVLGFAHTIGEFGVILMIGGSIPGQTKVISMVIYEHVEALEYANAHALAAIMLIFSFISLLILQVLNKNTAKRLQA